MPVVPIVGTLDSKLFTSLTSMPFDTKSAEKADTGKYDVQFVKVKCINPEKGKLDSERLH